jgi:hypothetical protein
MSIDGASKHCKRRVSSSKKHQIGKEDKEIIP